MRRTQLTALVLSAFMATLPALGSAQPQGDRDKEQEQKHQRQTQPQQPTQRDSTPNRNNNANKAPETRQPANARDNRAQQHAPAARQPTQQHARGAGPQRSIHQGERLPQEYRNRNYVVSNWKQHQLKAPPRGQQWVQVGADFVLVSIATNVIVSIVFGH